MNSSQVDIIGTLACKAYERVKASSAFEKAYLGVVVLLLLALVCKCCQAWRRQREHGILIAEPQIVEEIERNLNELAGRSGQHLQARDESEEHLKIMD